MTEEKIRTSPEVCAYVDDDHVSLTLEIALPGVNKENVDLKMHADSFTLRAPRDNVEYVASLAFCCPVRPDKAKAELKDGLLRVEVPFRDVMEDAVKVQIE